MEPRLNRQLFISHALDVEWTMETFFSSNWSYCSVWLPLTGKRIADKEQGRWRCDFNQHLAIWLQTVLSLPQIIQSSLIPLFCWNSFINFLALVLVNLYKFLIKTGSSSLKLNYSLTTFFSLSVVNRCYGSNLSSYHVLSNLTVYRLHLNIGYSLQILWRFSIPKIINIGPYFCSYLRI